MKRLRTAALVLAGFTAGALFLISCGGTGSGPAHSGSGVFSDSGQSLGSSFTNSVALGDLDGDNDLDLVTGNIGPNLVWMNMGSGIFTDSG